MYELPEAGLWLSADGAARGLDKPLANAAAVESVLTTECSHHLIGLKAIETNGTFFVNKDFLDQSFLLLLFLVFLCLRGQWWLLALALVLFIVGSNNPALVGIGVDPLKLQRCALSQSRVEVLVAWTSRATSAGRIAVCVPTQ